MMYATWLRVIGMAAVFGGDVTLHAGPGRNAYVLLPVIPDR